jgi:hypothetical protein
MAANSAPTTQWVQRRQACDVGRRMAKRWKAARKDCAWQPSDQTQVLLELSSEVRELLEKYVMQSQQKHSVCGCSAPAAHTHTHAHTRCHKCATLRCVS